MPIWRCCLYRNVNEHASATAKPCDNPNCKHIRNDDCCCLLLTDSLMARSEITAVGFVTLVEHGNETVIVGVGVCCLETGLLTLVLR